MASSVLPTSSTSSPDEDFDQKQHKRFFGGGHLQQFPVYNQPGPEVPVPVQVPGNVGHQPESKFFMSSLLNLHQNPNGGES